MSALEFNHRDILDWLAAIGSAPPDLVPAKRMERVRFRDLNICLGKQYLFVHQGSCEHVFVFTEMR